MTFLGVTGGNRRPAEFLCTQFCALPGYRPGGVQQLAGLDYGEDSTPLDCTPEQELVYSHCYWVPRHKPKGETIAPTTVLNQLFQLSTQF